jgi:addiction module HigA family antidote
MNMYNPPHPGSLVKHECLEALGLNVTEGASVLGVSRQALSNIVNEKAGISPEMAIRLEKAFGGTAETWLRMQMNFDIWHAKQRADDIHVERYEMV